jgi:CBS domain-containing protein
MTPAERKVLLACGAGGGLAATFGTPLAAVILAIELLLFEFRTRSFIPLVIACTVATAVRVSLLGGGAVFHVPPPEFGGPANLILFVGLGLLCGLLGAGLTRLLYLIEDGYDRLPVNTYLWPALGGLFVGLVGFALPRLGLAGADMFGPGYDVIGGILDGRYTLAVLVALFLCKGIVWLVSLGSGTSGGTLAPIFLIGAALGSIYGLLMARLFPGLDALPVAFAMAGMAAVFGSSTHATFASIVFAFEITQDYRAILPIMLTSVIADLVAHHLTPTNILTEQLRRGKVLVNHEYEADPLQVVPVSAVMISDPVTIAPNMPIGELMRRMSGHEPPFSFHQAALIADPTDGLRGIITRGDLLQCIEDGAAEDCPVIDVAATDVETAYLDEPVRSALERMVRSDVGRLPVVSHEDRRRIVGYLTRASILAAYRKRLSKEIELESGWLHPLQQRSEAPSE